MPNWPLSTSMVATYSWPQSASGKDNWTWLISHLVAAQSQCSLWGKSLWDDPSASHCLFLSMKPTSFAWLTGRHNPSYGLKSCPIWDLKREPIKIWNCNSVLWHWEEAELRALTQQNSNKKSSAFLFQLLPVFFVSFPFCLSESQCYSVAEPGFELMVVLLPQWH